MLCEISTLLGDSLLGIYLAINGIMALSVFVSSTAVFYYLYWPSNVTFEKWRYKVYSKDDRCMLSYIFSLNSQTPADEGEVD